MYKAGSSSLAAKEFHILISVKDKGGIFKLLKTDSDGGES